MFCLFLSDIYFWAYLLYFLAEAGYLWLDVAALIDTMYYTDFSWTLWYLILASIFVIDALLFFCGWIQNAALDAKKNSKTHIALDTSFWAEVFSIGGSLVYLGSSVLLVTLARRHPLSFVVTLYANNAIVGILLHALSSLLFFSVYRESDIENWYKNWKDPYWYGELLNLIPSFGYACSLTYVLIVTLPMGSAPSQDPNTDDIIHAALRIQTAINMACDGMWFIDSIIYGVAWIRGTTKIQSPDENKIEEIPSVFVTENFYEKPELPVTIQERKRQKKKRKATSLSNLVTMPHYTFREAPPYERGFFHPQKKKKQGKKVVSNKRAKSKQKTKPHKSHLPV